MNFYEELPGGTPLLTGEEEPELDPADMLLPTRAQLEAEDQGDKPADDKPVEGDKSADDEGNDKPVEGEPEDADQPEALYVAEVADPGPYLPADYSFEVQLFDTDNKPTKTVTIANIDDWDNLLDTDPNFGTPAQVLKAQRLATKMETRQEQDKAAYDQKAAAYKADQDAAEAANAGIMALENEMTYLVDKGEMPEVPKKYVKADWTDPEVAKQPGVKEQLELLNYMRTENAKRSKAGLKPFGSLVDAFNQFDRERARAQIKTGAANQAEARRQASARVGASKPGPVSNIPKGVAVGRVFRSLDDLG